MTGTRRAAVLLFVVLFVIALPTLRAATLTDSQLLSRAIEAADRHNYVDVVKYVYAYIQRDPALMRSDPDHSREILRALTNAEHNLRSQPTGRSTGAAGVGGKTDDASAGVAAAAAPVRITRPTRPGPPSGKARTTLRKFAGEFVGRNDGRRARLVIHMVDAPGPALRIMFEDLDRNVKFKGSHRPRPVDANHAHILRDVQLRRVGGEGKKVFKLLLLHTFDTNHITGVTSHSGREYGASFKRM